jgi:hypothetical protein
LLEGKDFIQADPCAINRVLLFPLPMGQAGHQERIGNTNKIVALLGIFYSSGNASGFIGKYNQGLILVILVMNHSPPYFLSRGTTGDNKPYHQLGGMKEPSIKG